jgi:hypothetical protein
MFNLENNNLQFKFLENQNILLNENTIPNIHFWDNTFLNNFLNYKTLVTSNSYNLINTPVINYLNDILIITPQHNNIVNLSEFFPERAIHFENFELSTLETDEGVFEALSTPDLKIFYPEPFIASPSFVHEDL